ncbi:MAG: hypothetical protein COB26_01170 [Piscirickettsiaceae bacterium]|nr:MAG: hypothetical protein COB26_11535 [Piscirickettsiaceae bacterium]PCI71468.1 MAG: hypothetical protein COB26_01170 [Piscirickettsiaceae bacterium]
MTIDLGLGLLIGMIFGFFTSLLFKKMSKGSDSAKVKELEAEHEQYRKKVDDHFVNTAILFKGLTDQYRDVYRHIATGAGDLCSEEAKANQIDLEETALLVKSPKVEEQIVDSTEAPKEPEETEQPTDTSANEEEVPLAGEAELPKELKDELKNKENSDK